MERPDVPRPHLFIAALGRSGSTMLANLFTAPPSRWVLIEPRFADASTGRDMLTQAESVGITITEEEWQRREGETDRVRISRLFSARLSQLDRWGLKEVRGDLSWPTIELLDPIHTIVLVRDLRDAAVSLLEKVAADGDARYGDAWLRRYLTDSPAAILDLMARIGTRSHRVVTYEELVADAGELSSIGHWLDWQPSGQPDRNLATLFNRGREVELHGGAVTGEAVGRHRQSDHPDSSEIVAWVESVNADFQSFFGYK